MRKKIFKTMLIIEKNLAHRVHAIKCIRPTETNNQEKMEVPMEGI